MQVGLSEIQWLRNKLQTAEQQNKKLKQIVTDTTARLDQIATVQPHEVHSHVSDARDMIADRLKEIV